MNGPLRATYRILDASINRASEGLRTMEEFARFVLDDAETTETLKTLRHRLTAAINRLDRNDFLTNRDTNRDVGTAISTQSELDRKNLCDVVAAAAARVAQSLRVIEEYAKTIDVEISREAESLRYRSYTVAADLEQAAKSMVDEEIGQSRRGRLQSAMLYVLIDCSEDAKTFETNLRRLIETETDVFQLRDKSASDRVLYDRACVASRLIRQANKLFIVNDRSDIAIAAEADGVHVGQTELPVDATRRMIGDQCLVGVSTHNVDQVHEAIAGGADYIGCGPVFAGNTKSFVNYPGPEFLRNVHESTQETPRPAFAIGGIGIHNVDQVRQAGFHRIAVSGAIRDAEDPAVVAAQLKKTLSS